MRWLLGSLSAVLLATFLGCGREPAPEGQGQPQVKVEPPPKGDGQQKTKNADPFAPAKGLLNAPAHDDPRDKYEAALAEALHFLADQKWKEALVALEAARTFQDNEFIQGEIARVKNRIDQEAAALKTVQNLESILDEGKGAEAATLAKTALEEFGDGDYSAKLVKLRLQADALQAAEKNEAADARYQRFRGEGEAALKEKNLRAAALAFEQALSARDDANLKRQLDELRTSLDTYDSLRRKAADLRREPVHLEDALDTLREAEKIWPTLPVRHDIDEVALALEKRRDNVSVGDFDVRGEVGLADAGRTVAEELLPHLKPRFDLVERGQISKVLGELKLEANLADDWGGQRELGKLAKVRYLVVGSVSRAGGVTVHARLVETRSGLIVQTAKLTAATADEALRRLPELARQLLMTDEEKLVYDQQQAQAVQRIEPIPVAAPLPPAPDRDDAPPPPIFVEAPQPAFAGLSVQHFKALPPPPVGLPLPLPVGGGQVEVQVKTRLLHAAVQLGDDLFRRGQYRDAHRHFELALQLSPGHVGIGVRIERSARHVPPPVVVIVERPLIVVKPRVAVLGFVTIGDPRLVPPALGPWTAHQLAPYFSPHFELVDPAEVYWYMGRMGMTMRDLMDDPHARRWLARAVGVRSFVLGTIEHGSLDVNAYLIDAEYGYVQGSGRVLARNPFELRLLLGDLARQTLLDPVERARLLAEADRFDALMLRGRQSLDRRELQIAITVFEDALKLRPGHVQVSFYLNRSRELHRNWLWEEQRRQQLAARLAAEEAARRRQWELAQAVELARIRAAQHAAALAGEQRRLEEQRRLTASQALVVQAQVAIKTKNFSIAVNFFEGALAFRPRDDAIVRQMAQARADAERAAQLRAVQEAALREDALRRQREQELTLARQQLEQQRQRELAANEAARKAQDDRDRLAYQTAFDEGQRLLNTKQYDGAIAALQSARRLRKTDAVEALLQRAFADQAYAQAEAKGKDEADRVRLQLAKERARRKQAEDEAKANQKRYEQALQLAQQALTQKNFDVAQANYQEAGKVFQTDAVLTGLRQVETGRVQAAAAADAGKRKLREETERAAKLRELLASGQAALDAKEYSAAAKSFTQAKKLAPDNVDVLAGLTRAEQGRDRLLAEARRKADQTDRAQNFQRFLKNGQDNLAAKQYDAAVVALQEALKLSPDDGAAKSALAQALKARQGAVTDAAAQADAKKKSEAYQQLITTGRLALDSKRFDEAIRAFGDAQKLLPGDKLSASALQDAQRSKQAAQDAIAAAAKKRAEELQRAADLKKYLAEGRAALAGKDLAAAAKALDQAAKLSPANPDVAQAARELRAAQSLAQIEDDTRRKRAEQYGQLLAAGRKALTAKQYDDAVKTLSDAVRLIPDDKIGLALLDQAQRAQADARAAAATEKTRLEKERLAKVKTLVGTGQAALKAKDLAAAAKALTAARELAPQDPVVLAALRDFEQARQADLDAAARRAKADMNYRLAVARGEKALAGKRFEEAITAFGEAAKLRPDDKTAPQLLQQAQKAYDAAKKAAPKIDPIPKIDPKAAKLQGLLQKGQALEKQQKHKEAMQAYQDALALSPKDKDAAAGARRAEFSFRVAEGQRHLEAKRYPDAIREFEAALVLAPNNATVQKLLQKAKQGKK